MKDSRNNKSFDQKRIAELNQKIDLLEQRFIQKCKEVDRLKDAIISNISHEIRTPMNAIMGFSSLLHDSELSDHDRRVFIDGIDKSSKNLLKLIDNIILTAKLETQKIEIQENECIVEEMLTELFYEHQDEKEIAGKSNVEIKFPVTTNKKKVKIITDTAKLKTILSNLIDNAIKFNENGKVEFGYHLTEDNYIQFFIKDSGIGIPQDKLDVIFDKFCHVEEIHTKKYNGLGIGLTITNRLVKKLGGEIELFSTVKRGTKVIIKIPCKEAEYQTTGTYDEIFGASSITFKDAVMIKPQLFPRHEVQARDNDLSSWNTSFRA